MALLRQNMFAYADFDLPGYDPHLADVAFDGSRFRTLTNVSFTGSSAYRGGVKPDGTPALDGLIEYNTDHPMSKPAMLGFIAHEIIAHYVDSVMSDLRWRAGQLGAEGAVHTMCTAETAAREGVAQNALDLIYGGKEQDVVDAPGEDQRIQAVLERLQDAGKNNASILFQMQGVSSDELRRHLETDCVLPDPYVRKLSGAWAQHPIMGSMYGPAYQTGYHVVRAAIDRHGPYRTMEAALHKYGYTDLATFPEVLKKAA